MSEKNSSKCSSSTNAIQCIIITGICKGALAHKISDLLIMHVT